MYSIFHSNFHCYTQAISHSEQLLQVKDLKEEVLHQFEELIEKKSKVLHSDSHMTLYYSHFQYNRASVTQCVCMVGVLHKNVDVISYRFQPLLCWYTVNIR